MSSTTTSPTSEKHSTVDSVQLRAQQVGVSFGTDEVLRDVSFAIREGEFIGLVGQNGSGKTTLLRVMLGLLQPTTGTAERQNGVIGYVPQRGQLYNGIVPMSVLEVVALGSNGDRAKAHDALQQVSMNTFSHRNFNELSGGQQQRVVIAKALASGARVLVLDEPTTGVDEASKAEFYTLLQRLHRDGHTIIMVSHDIDSVVLLVSRIIFLNRQIVYDGPSDQFDLDYHILSQFGAKAHREHDHA